jgi:hypothetical protein
MDVIASRANSVQWLVHYRELAPSAEHVWNKERVPGARNGYCITTRGYLGVDQRTKTETEQEQSNGGEFPKTLTPSRASISRIPLNSKYTISLYLSLNTFLFETHCFKLNPDIARISFFLFFCCTTSFVSRAPFTKQIFWWLNITKNYFTSFTSKSDT